MIIKKDILDYNFEEGELILIDKPLDWTSFDVVKKIRSALRVKKVGHAGTLDPLASGLLIIALGKATKKINDLQNLSKSYTGIIEIGRSTPSYDLETDFDNKMSIDNISEEMIKTLAEKMLGWQDQIPPIYSAIKKEGRRAYTLARKGQDAKLDPRKVNIEEFYIPKIKLPEIYFEISCSKGTYIRSIARDFGERLKNVAYLKQLRRTKIGDYSVSEAWQLDEFIKAVNQT